MYDAVHLFARALDELDRSQVKLQSIIKANIAQSKVKGGGEQDNLNAEEMKI
jgi:hypothetical protein